MRPRVGQRLGPLEMLVVLADRDAPTIPDRRYALCEYVRGDDPEQFVADARVLEAPHEEQLGVLRRELDQRVDDEIHDFVAHLVPFTEAVAPQPPTKKPGLLSKPGFSV